MSMPIRSTSAHGPIGQPAPCFMPVSRSSGVTRASSRTRMQSFSSGMRTRLTTKPGVSLQRIGSLPSCPPNVKAARRLVVGELRAHDLDELHERRRVEEVHPDDALRVLARGRELGHRERGRVRRDDRVARQRPLELGEDLALDRRLLEHGLDHDVAVGEVGELGRARSRAASRRARPGRAGPSRPCGSGSARSAPGRAAELGVTSRPTRRAASIATCAMPAPIVPSPTTPTFTGGILEPTWNASARDPARRTGRRARPRARSRRARAWRGSFLAPDEANSIGSPEPSSTWSSSSTVASVVTSTPPGFSQSKIDRRSGSCSRRGTCPNMKNDAMPSKCCCGRSRLVAST